MSHNKRSSMPKEWPIARKGTAYYAVASHSGKHGIPLVIALRDVLKMVSTRKEARIMLLNKEVSVNKKIRKDEKFPVRLFDMVGFEKSKKNYQLIISGKRVKFKEVSEKESGKKVVKIIGKVVVDKSTMQINLDDGSNFLIKDNCMVGDSVLINLKENKIEKIIPLKEGANVLIVNGKHSGKEGKVTEVVLKENQKQYSIKFKEGEAVLQSRIVLAVE